MLETAILIDFQSSSMGAAVGIQALYNITVLPTSCCKKFKPENGLVLATKIKLPGLFQKQRN